MNEDLQTSSRLLCAMGEVGKSLRHLFSSQGSPVPGIDSAYLLILIKLDDQRLRVGKLAELVHSDTSTVSRQVHALEAMGLLSKSPDPADGRCQVIQLTGKGSEVRGQVIQHRAGLIADGLQGLSSDEVHQLLHLLDKMTASINAQLDAPNRPDRAAQLTA